MRVEKLLMMFSVVVASVLPIVTVVSEVKANQLQKVVEWEVVEEVETEAIIRKNISDTAKEKPYREDPHDYVVLAKRMEEEQKQVVNNADITVMHTNIPAEQVEAIVWEEEVEESFVDAPPIISTQTIEAPTEIVGGNNKWGINLTPEERETLAKVVWLEAGNQGLIGQMYVVGVIFNRTVTPGCAGCGSVTGVMSAKGQFAVWSYHNKGTPTAETYLAIDQMLNGTAPQEVYNAGYLFFQRAAIGTKIGDHYFH